MEKNSVIDLSTIQNVRCDLNDENVIKFEHGLDPKHPRTAVFSIPKDGKKNAVYEYIKDTFGEDYINQLKAERDKKLKEIRQYQEIRQEGEKHSREMSLLFECKQEAFRNFWMDKADSDTKLALRSAPNIAVVSAIVNSEYLKYMQENNLTHLEMSDEQEEFMYE
jgi:hypothetical protein